MLTGMSVKRANAGPSGPSVIVAATKIIEDGPQESPTDSYARVTVNSDGDLYAYTGTSSVGIGSSYETYLDDGLNTEVWVQMTIVSGSLQTSAGTGRLACTANRTWGRETTFNGNSRDTTVIDLDFYDAASGGNLLDSQEVTLITETIDLAE